MVIDSLMLKNVGLVKDADLQFRKGINLVIGDNGSGKSTILKGLSLVYFNKIKGNLGSLQSWYEDEPYEISSTCQLDGRKHISDYHYKKEVSRELTVGEDYYKNSEASAYLAELLDPQLSLASMIAFEGEVDLISTKPAERREHLKKIYDLTFLSQISSLDSDKVSLEETKLVPLERDIVKYETKEYKIKDEKPSPFTVEKYEQYLVDQTNIQVQLATITADEALRKIKIKALDDSSKTVTSIQNIIDSKNSALLTAKSESEKASNELAKDWLVTLKVLEDKVGVETVEHTNLATYKQSLKDIRLTRPISYDSVKMTQLTTQRQTLSVEKLSLTNKIAVIQSGKCGECGAVYENNSERLKELSSDLLEVSRVLEGINSDIAELLLVKEKADAAILANEQAKASKVNLTNQIEATEKAISTATTTLTNQIISEKELIETRKDNAKTVEDAAKATVSRLDTEILEQKNALNTAQTVKDKAQLEIDAMPIVQSSLALQADKDQLKSYIDEYIKVLHENETIKTFNIELEQSKKSDTLLLEKLNLDKDEVVIQLNDYKTAITYLKKDFPTFIIRQLIQSIEVNMNTFISKTYESRYEIKIKEKGDSIKVVYGPKDEDVSLSSGYEKQIFSLAWKDALSQIQQTGVLILDEVASAGSTKNSFVLYETILEMSKDYEQIFIITHREEVQDWFEANGANIFKCEEGVITNL